MLRKKLLLIATCGLMLASSASAADWANRTKPSRPNKNNAWKQTKNCSGGLVHIGRGHFICLKK